jgi:hypothetical protein
MYHNPAVEKTVLLHINVLRRVWRYQSGNQNPYIEEEQTTQWPIEKVQKDKQRSTRHTYKAKNRVAPTPLKCRIIPAWLSADYLVYD